MNNEIKDNIPARTSHGLTRSSSATTRNRVANDICVPRKILRNSPDLSYVQPEGNYYFKTSDSYQILRSCSINISDCLKSAGICDSSPCITTCKIKTEKNNTCKTSIMLITSPEFTSNLTGKSYYTKSFDPLDCSTKHVIYGIECTLCGLLYVGETRQTLRSRMSQHRYRNLYNHFNQPGHNRCLTMKVRIIEKIYHHTNSLCLVHLTVPIESCFGLNS